MPIIIPEENGVKVSDVLAQIRALGYERDTTDQQIVMLNSILRRVVNARRWSFMLYSAFVEVSPEEPTPEINGVAGTFRIDSLQLNERDLTHVSDEEISEFLIESKATGIPRYWALRGGNLITYPVPDTTYEFKLDAVANAVAVIDEEDEVIIPQSHVDILVWGVIEQITFRERDWDGHNYARQMYADLFTEMIGQYGMKQRGQATHVHSSGQNEHFDVEDVWPIYGP